MAESVELLDSELELSLPDVRAGKYLFFQLATGDFGVTISKVREVLEMQGITRVPNAPAFIAGVLNLRGKVIPVVDLRLTFGLGDAPVTTQTCIVVVRTALASVEQVLGILVDAVTEVIHLQGTDFLETEEFQPVSEFGTRDPAPYLLGVARVEGKVTLLLDLDEVLNHPDLRPVPFLSVAA